MLMKLNGRWYDVGDDFSTPLLWVLRDRFGLKGTKYACDSASCGACTVTINGKAELSCQKTIADVDGEVLTIEGVGKEKNLHPVQQAWLDEQVPDCGYCQSGQIMAAISLLSRNSNPSDAEINEAMRQNLCRCGTYPRIRLAIKRAAELLRTSS
ncbi:MAG: (2Fe-2S)-binding protein [Rhizobiaceae bacterium]